MSYLDLLGFLATHPIESFFVLLIQFIIVMKIHHKAHNQYLHYVLSAWFIPQDFIVNMVLFTIVGLELPKEWLVTHRLSRWKKVNDLSRLGRWRCGVGEKLCQLLNRFDTGHC
jgi:hypothetical protein